MSSSSSDSDYEDNGDESSSGSSEHTPTPMAAAPPPPPVKTGRSKPSQPDHTRLTRYPVKHLDPFPGVLHPPGSAETEAAALYVQEGYAQLLSHMLVLELDADQAPERGGYERPPGDRNTIRWHGASDSIQSARALPLDHSAMVRYHNSVGSSRVSPNVASCLRLRQFIPAALAHQVTQQWHFARLAGIQNLEPETARGSDPALHCSFWLVVGPHPELPRESSPHLLPAPSAAALMRLCSEIAVVGQLILRVLVDLDPVVAQRMQEHNAGLKWWYRRITGRDFPNHWDFGAAAAIAVKGGGATGMHLDHHDDLWAHSMVASLAVGDGGFRGMYMFVPQQRLLVPCEDRDVMGFPARLYRHMNVAGVRVENRLAITFFTTKRQLRWGLLCYDCMVQIGLAQHLVVPPQGYEEHENARLPANFNWAEPTDVPAYVTWAPASAPAPPPPAAGPSTASPTTTAGPLTMASSTAGPSRKHPGSPGPSSRAKRPR